MVERRHQDLVGIPGPMQCEAGSKLGELVIPRHCRYCRQSWVRKRLKRILSILNTLLYCLQLVFIFSFSIVFFTVITVSVIVGVIVGVDEDDGGVASRSGALALASLIHVTLFGCIVDCDMPADPGGREARKTLEIAPINRFE